MTLDPEADDWAPPAPREAERELDFAAAVAAALKRQRPNAFVQGRPDAEEVIVDGSFDLRLVARELLKGSAAT